MIKPGGRPESTAKFSLEYLNKWSGRAFDVDATYSHLFHMVIYLHLLQLLAFLSNLRHTEQLPVRLLSQLHSPAKRPVGFRPNAKAHFQAHSHCTQALIVSFAVTVYFMFV